MIEELLRYSYEHQLSHIPSALSMIDYLDVLTSKLTPHVDRIVIGKPFGSQAYYLVWKKYQWIDTIENLSIGVKHDELPFVDFSEETIGNALGVAAGIAMTTNDRVWVNITDASLQMGNVLEAIQFIGQRQLPNILVTVDNNNAQVTGKTSDIICTTPIIELARLYGWQVIQSSGHDKTAITKAIDSASESVPTIIFFNTTKGHGVPAMIQHTKSWHYRTITNQDELDNLISSAQQLTSAK